MRENEKRILVTDDDDAIRALLLTVLRRRGFKVDTAKNGEEALQRCASCRYSVVLLDLMMPKMSGYEFLSAVEAQPIAERPLILVLTAGTPPRTLDPELVAGSIRKPFDIELLVDTITACITTAPDRPQLDNCPPADTDRGDHAGRGDEPN